VKEIFIFGAGASYASASTPLGSELVWNYHANCGHPIPIINGVPDNSRENVRFSNFKKFLPVAAQYYPELKGELFKWENRGESIYHLRPFNKKYYVDELLKMVLENGDTEGIEVIKKLILEHITCSGLNTSNKLYNEFAKQVLKNKPFGSVSIISFNFDCLLHEDFRNEVYFDYLLDFDWIDPNREKIYKKQNSISLIKLHGSLDWGICRNCNRLYLYFFNVQKGFYDQKRCTEDCEGMIDPFIVVPYHKYNGKINVLWTKAERELKQAKKITIIGYSFPEYDKMVIDLFKNTLDAHVEIDVVDYHELNSDITCVANSIKEKYRRLFPKLKREIKIYLGGFEEYMNNCNRTTK